MEISNWVQGQDFRIWLVGIFFKIPPQNRSHAFCTFTKKTNILMDSFARFDMLSLVLDQQQIIIKKWDKHESILNEISK